MATYGQYPGIVAHQVADEGVGVVARRMIRSAGRVLRHGA